MSTNKKHRTSSSQENLIRAVAAVQGGFSGKKASEQFNVPRTTKLGTESDYYHS